MTTTARIPNIALRTVREAMHFSQEDLAEKMRAAGATGITKRSIQRWEAGEVIKPRPTQARALEQVTRLSITQLGFPEGVDSVVVDDGRGGHDLEIRALPAPTGPQPGYGNYSGIWLSTYHYFSSGRHETLSNAHYVVIHHLGGDQLAVRSVYKPEKSLLTMDLTMSGNVATGTWMEATEHDGYYRGAVYHGAIQLLADPTGRRIEGKWVGFGKEMQINTGPWWLTFVDPNTSKSTVTRFAEMEPVPEPHPEAEQPPA